MTQGHQKSISQRKIGHCSVNEYSKGRICQLQVAVASPLPPEEVSSLVCDLSDPRDEVVQEAGPEARRYNR